ncbi:hypothetical protein [Paraburkholderia caballeronis]|nr:hypothetical protein [Paraburkholderia caballeronis]
MLAFADWSSFVRNTKWFGVAGDIEPTSESRGILMAEFQINYPDENLFK